MTGSPQSTAAGTEFSLLNSDKLREAAKKVSFFSGPATRGRGLLRAWPLRKNNFLRSFKISTKKFPKKMWPLSSKEGATKNNFYFLRVPKREAKPLPLEFFVNSPKKSIGGPMPPLPPPQSLRPIFKVSVTLFLKGAVEKHKRRSGKIFNLQASLVLKKTYFFLQDSSCVALINAFFLQTIKKSF